MATHSSILAWKIPWTEEPGGLLQCVQGLQCACVCVYMCVCVSKKHLLFWTSFPFSHQRLRRVPLCIRLVLISHLFDAWTC